MCLYGCQLWDFDDKEVKLFYVAWRKTVRRVWNIPQRTHSNFLNYICNDLPIDTQLHVRFIKFIYKIVNSSNICTSLCGKLALHGSMSPTCNSVNKVCYTYNVNKCMFYNCKLNEILGNVKSYHHYLTDEAVKRRAVAILEGITLRDNLEKDNANDIGFTFNELNDIY